MGLDNNVLYTADIPTHLDASSWTLYDKVTYGGLGYGSFSLPQNFFVIIITCLFPPLGQLITSLGKSIKSEYPFLTWDCLHIIFKPDDDKDKPSNFTKIIYSFLLTCLFYIPGLVYVLGNIVETDNITSKTN
jgi:uncharacterized membrane protein YqaE (UPF0057 family)